MRSLRTIRGPKNGVPVGTGTRLHRAAIAETSVDRPEVVLLVASGDRVFPVRLVRGTVLIAGRSPEANIRLDDPKVSPRHLCLRSEPDGSVEVEELNRPSRALLNDVQLSEKSRARVGDQISVGDSAILILRALAPAARQLKVAGASELDERLAAEAARARRFHRPFSLLLLKSAALAGIGSEDLGTRLSALVDPLCTWGTLGPLVRALICPEMKGEELAVLRGKLAAALGAEGHRFSIGYASFPGDGLDAHCILETALSRIVGQESVRSPSADESLFLDSSMVRLVALVEKLARGPAPVLFHGEPGPGRRALAQLLHQRSARAAGPFARVAGFSLPSGSADAELFGAEEGAAGAERARVGALESASGGTVFIEEIGELPLGTQAKLAQALDRRAATRLGSDQSYAVDVRLITATQDDLGARVREGTFREDLHSRLSANVVLVPPLRHRLAEVAALAELFLARCRRIHGRPRLTLSPDARAALLRYSWPGNVRELKNAVERASLIAEADEIRLDALPSALGEERGSDRAVPGHLDLRSSLKMAEREAFLKTLAMTRWNVTEAAKRLGLPRRTVIYRMSRLGLRRPGR